MVAAPFSFFTVTFDTVPGCAPLFSFNPFTSSFLQLHMPVSSSVAIIKVCFFISVCFGKAVLVIYVTSLGFVPGSHLPAGYLLLLATGNRAALQTAWYNT